jgi:amino acid transporter
MHHNKHNPMARRSFFIALAAVASAVAVLLMALNSTMPFSPYGALGWLSWSIFLALSILVYFIGQRVANSSNKSDFLSFTMGLIALKMFLGIALVVIYDKYSMPVSSHFLAHFFLTYFSFSIFEYYCLDKIARNTP